MTLEHTLATAIREAVKIGNIGPNAAGILAVGGTVSLTPVEAEEAAAHVADAIRTHLTSEAVIALVERAIADACDSCGDDYTPEARAALAAALNTNQPTGNQP